jgi:hypothetical protein
MKRPLMLITRSHQTGMFWSGLLDKKGYSEVEVYDDPAQAIKFLSDLSESELKRWLETGLFVVGFLFGLSKPEGRVLVEFLKRRGVPIKSIVRSSVFERGESETEGHPFVRVMVGRAVELVDQIVKFAEGS